MTVLDIVVWMRNNRDALVHGLSLLGADDAQRRDVLSQVVDLRRERNVGSKQSAIMEAQAGEA